jgi:hypothetical protein
LIVGLPLADKEHCYLVNPEISIAVRAFSDDPNRNDIATYSRDDIQPDGSIVCSEFVYDYPRTTGAANTVTKFTNTNLGNTIIMTGSGNMHVTRK